MRWLAFFVFPKASTPRRRWGRSPPQSNTFAPQFVCPTYDNKVDITTYIMTNFVFQKIAETTKQDSNRLTELLQHNCHERCNFLAQSVPETM